MRVKEIRKIVLFIGIGIIKKEEVFHKVNKFKYLNSNVLINIFTFWY